MSQHVTFFLSSNNHHNHHTTMTPTTTTTQRPMPTTRYNETDHPWMPTATHEPKQLPTNPNDCSQIETFTHISCGIQVPRCWWRRGNWTTNDDIGHRSSFLFGESHPRFVPTPHWQPDDKRQHLSSFVDTSQWWHMRQQHRSMTQRPRNNDTARMQDANTHSKDTGRRHSNTQWRTMMTTWNKTHNDAQQQQHGSKTHNDEHTTTTDHPHVGMRLTTPPSPFPLTPPFPPTSFPFPSTPLFPYPSSLNIPLPFNTPLSFNILPPSLLDIPLPSPSCSLSTSPIPLKYL